MAPHRLLIGPRFPFPSAVETERREAQAAARLAAEEGCVGRPIPSDRPADRTGFAGADPTMAVTAQKTRRRQPSGFLCGCPGGSPISPRAMDPGRRPRLRRSPPAAPAAGAKKAACPLRAVCGLVTSAVSTVFPAGLPSLPGGAPQSPKADERRLWGICYVPATAIWGRSCAGWGLMIRAASSTPRLTSRARLSRRISP